MNRLFHCWRLWDSRERFSPSHLCTDYSTSLLLEWLPQLCAPTPSQELSFPAAQPADPQVLLLALLENRSDVGFLSIHSTFFWSPQSFKDCFPMSMISASLMSPRGWVSWGPVNLQISNWFQCPFSQCVSMEDYSCLQIFPVGSGFIFLKGNLTSKRRGKEGIEYLGSFHALSPDLLPHLILQQINIFSNLPFATGVPVKAFLVALLFPC